MIAGDHYGADARCLAGTDGGCRFRSWRVNQADHTDEDKIPLKRLRSASERILRNASKRHTEDPHAVGGKAVIFSADALAPVIIQRLAPTVEPDRTGRTQQDIHSPFGKSDIRVRTFLACDFDSRRHRLVGGGKAMYRSHHLSFRRERNFRNAWQKVLQLR